MRIFKHLCAIALGLALSGLAPYASAQSQADLCAIGTRATTTVSSAKTLKSALSKADPGTTIVVRGGNYSGDFTLSKSGRASNPITIRAGGKVTFKNSVFTLRGSYAVLTGMTFDNGMVTILGDYNRVTRNVFKNGEKGGNKSKLHSAVHTEGGARYNRIDHNEVVNWKRRGLRSTKLQNGTKGNRFDHNYLHKMTGASGNSGEAFQVGTADKDTAYTPGTIFEYNLIDGHTLESEVVSLKSNGNTIRGNTFMNAKNGHVTTRMGSNNKIVNNTFINLSSLSIYADDNEVIGNKFVKTNCEARSGNVLFPELVKNRRYEGGHPAARNTLIAGNQFSSGKIRLGRKGSGKRSYNRTFPADKTTLAGNKGAQVEVAGAVRGTRRSSYSGRIGKPVQLKPSQVGPNAPDPVCDGVIDVAALPPKNLAIIAAHP